MASTTQVANLNASLIGGQPVNNLALLSAPNAFTAQNQFNTGLVASANGVNYAVQAVDSNTFGQTYGVLATTANPFGFAVKGTQNEGSQVGGAIGASGVWGDSTSNPGVVGTSDVSIGGWFLNNSSEVEALVVSNRGSAGPAIFLGNTGDCEIDGAGDLACSGSKSAVVPVDNLNRKVALYAVESPENWFEDFGSGQLSNGSATVTLEPVFAQTVNAGVEYHVFLTPNGDSQGHLYVTNKTAASFEVHESAGGQSSIPFDYRIVARRKGYESIRLADKTKEFDPARRPNSPPPTAKNRGGAIALPSSNPQKRTHFEVRFAAKFVPFLSAFIPFICGHFFGHNFSKKIFRILFNHFQRISCSSRTPAFPK